MFSKLYIYIIWKRSQITVIKIIIRKKNISWYRSIIYSIIFVAGYENVYDQDVLEKKDLIIKNKFISKIVITVFF
jgi:predicted neutral ceramidase superfamily lipid hydrolase